jgi:phosphate:Na+ symporter
MGFAWKQGVVRHYGAMLMGLGLIFYGMAAMGSAMAPLRTHEGFAELLQSLKNPVLGMLAGAVFTALVQSSSATIGLSVVMATQGLLSLPAGIAILFGAKIGTGITAILAAIGKPRDAKRAAAVHVLFNVLGAVIWLPFIAQLAGFAEMVSPVAAHLEGVERLAEEVPRQIANAATIWATANTLLFLPFAGLFATLAIRIIPDRPVEEEAIIRPRYLDHELIQVPSMALERARMELGYMAELAEDMLGKVRSVLETRDLGELSRQHDRIVVLREAVLGYLQQVGRGEFSDAEADEHARLVAATGEIENMSAALSHELIPLAQTLKEAKTTPSKETTDLLERLFQTIKASAHSALKALVAQDEQAAQAVVANRDAILKLSAEFHRQQAMRLAGNEPDRLLRLRVQLEMLDRMRRLYSVAEHMAISVLPGSVLAAEVSA